MQNPSTEDVDDLAAMMGQVNIDKSKCEICKRRFGIPFLLSSLSDTENRKCSDCSTLTNGDFSKEGGLKENWVSSAKVDAILKKIGEIFAASNDDKVLVFSQFTSFLDIIQIALEREGYLFARYDGKMNSKVKEENLHSFKTNPMTRIFLVSLKCGSTGLNLTIANHVLMCDIWWYAHVKFTPLGIRLLRVKQLIARIVSVKQSQ